MILDEPTSGLDPNQVAQVRDLIGDLSQNKTILLSTHILQEVEAVADRVIFIHEGRKVFDGTIDDVVIYSRALDESEIGDLAQGMSPDLAVEPNGKLATAWGMLKR